MALPKLLGQLQPVDEAESPGPQGIIAGGFANDSIGRPVLLWDQLQPGVERLSLAIVASYHLAVPALKEGMMGRGSEAQTLAFALHNDPDVHSELTELVAFQADGLLSTADVSLATSFVVHIHGCWSLEWNGDQGKRSSDRGAFISCSCRG
jgi:hypothetical protein